MENKISKEDIITEGTEAALAKEMLIAQLEEAYQAGAKEALRTDQMVDHYDFEKYYKSKYGEL